MTTDEDGSTRIPAPRPGEGLPEDPEATVIRPAGRPASLPSATDAAVPDPDASLPPGHRLEQFEVQQRIGKGGFSVVYRVFDHRLQVSRALKEYFPRDFAARRAGWQVVPRSRRDDAVFQAGLGHFIKESVTLARFDHPSLIRVYQTIEANGTAYMVMQLAQGETLQDVVGAMAAPPDEAWLMRLLDPLTAALAVVHQASTVHRDIKPENVLLLEGSGLPVLLDFGAARQVIDHAGQPTGILTPGYAPIEQYPDSGLAQGPWTDIYALAATVHRLMTGTAPPNALVRRINDTQVALATRLAGRYSARLLGVMDRCLAVDPAARPHSIGALREALGFGDAAAGASSPATTVGTAVTPARPAVPRLAWAGFAVLLAAGAALLAGLARAPTPTPTPTQAAAPPASPAPPAPTVAPTATPTVATTPEASAAPTPTVLNTTNTSSPGPSAEAGAAARPGSAVTPAQVAIEPEAAFDAVEAGANADRRVTVNLEQSVLKVSATPLRLNIRAQQAGWVYVLIHDTDREVRVLFPSRDQADNRIAADRPLTWPPHGVDMRFGQPTGSARLLVVVADTALDLGAVTQRMDGDWRLLRQGASLRNLPASAQAGGRHPFAGQPACAPQSPCSPAYGAASARFEVR